MSAYHSQDGWYWRRLIDGAVQVSHKEGGNHERIEMEIRPNIWASIVAHVSAISENADTFYLAEQLHGGDLPQIRELLRRARLEGELPDELMAEVDIVLGIQAAGIDANMERYQ
jgi:hypothetical protein